MNLNGLFARLTGRRKLNGVVKLNNGMLSVPLNEVDTTGLEHGVAEFSGYLRDQDLSFLYVQLPYKESLDGQSLPAGVTTYRDANSGRLPERLSAAGVETLDLSPLLCQTPEMLERYFYRTDHHWTSDGALVGFQAILGRLDEMLPEGNIDLTYAQAGQWERHEIEDWFLGTWGKRVGVFFGGLDPLIWHTPRFETEMSCAVPVHGLLYRGDFAGANIRERYIEEKYYFDDSAYLIYIGGDYPLVQHRNPTAPSPLKVLLLKDSFSLPLQAYLSTAFQAVDVIDPRYFWECSAAEYVEMTKPDVVILALNPDQQGTLAYQDFGVEAALAARVADGPGEAVLQRQDIGLSASEDDHNYTAYPLEAGTVYRVVFEGVDVPEGQADGVGLRLYDKTAAAVLKSMIFDVACCEAAGGFSWTFRTPDTPDELQLLFYAGIYGSTTGNSVVYRGVTVEKLNPGET